VMVTNSLGQTLLLLAAAVLGFLNAVNGLWTGRSSIFVPGGFKRSEHPLQYWTSIIMSAGIGVAAFVVLLWKAF